MQAEAAGEWGGTDWRGEEASLRGRDRAGVHGWPAGQRPGEDGVWAAVRGGHSASQGRQFSSFLCLPSWTPGVVSQCQAGPG